jgi:hypothetical protein
MVKGNRTIEFDNGDVIEFLQAPHFITKGVLLGSLFFCAYQMHKQSQLDSCLAVVLTLKSSCM